MAADLSERLNTLARWLLEAKYPVVFTGAGISTESGLRDFRGPDGLWTRRDKGLSTPASDWADARPNSGHLAIVALQDMGRLAFLISQNVDNLHLRSGISPELMAELHGNMTKDRCTECDFVLDRFEDQAVCPLCGGRLKPSVVDFGDPMPRKDMDDAYHHSGKSDLFIVAGSTLVVSPAADMPAVALQAGARLVIINRGETPFDRHAHLRFTEAIGEVLPPAVARLKKLVEAGS